MIRWLATACLILTFSTSAYAQNASISGTVVDESGAGVPGATVQLTGPRRDVTTSVTVAPSARFTPHTQVCVDIRIYDTSMYWIHRRIETALN